MGYWTTDFLVVQRILGAKDIRSAEMAPIIGAGFKMLVPIIVILPGLLGLAVLPVEAGFRIRSRRHRRAQLTNDVLPLMLARLLRPRPPSALELRADCRLHVPAWPETSVHSRTVWTYDIYRPLINSKGTDHHYVNMGRWTTVIGRC